MKVPSTFLDYITKNKSPIERILAGLPKGIKKCGSKKFKNAKGTE